MAWAINMTIMSVICFIFNSSRINRDSSSPFFRSLVNIGISLEIGLLPISEIFCDCCCQSSFSVINDQWFQHLNVAWLDHISQTMQLGEYQKESCHFILLSC